MILARSARGWLVSLRLSLADDLVRGGTGNPKDCRHFLSGLARFHAGLEELACELFRGFFADLLLRAAFDNDRHLAPHLLGCQILCQRVEGATANLLMELGQLPRDHSAPISEEIGELAQRSGCPSWSLEQHEREARRIGAQDEAAALGERTRQESEEDKRAIHESGDCRGRGHCRWSRDHGHGETGGRGCFDQVAPGVGDAWRSSIADEGDVALVQRTQETLAASALVEGVVANHRCGDPEVPEQLSGVARILRGDERDITKNSHGARREIFKVSEWGSHKI